MLLVLLLLLCLLLSFLLCSVELNFCFIVGLSIGFLSFACTNLLSRFGLALYGSHGVVLMNFLSTGILVSIEV